MPDTSANPRLLRTPWWACALAPLVLLVAVGAMSIAWAVLVCIAAAVGLWAAWRRLWSLPHA